MKCHFSIQARTHSIVDLNKKLPFTKEYFPNAKIDKKMYAGTEFVIANNCLNDVKIQSIKNIKCNANLNFDLYTTSIFGHSIFFMSFDISTDTVNQAIDLIEPENLMMKTTVLIEGKEQTVANLFATLAFPYFQIQELIDMSHQEKYLDDTRKGMEKLREDVVEKAHTNYFFTADGPSGSISGGPGPVIIEDYDNEISAGDQWEDIGLKEGVLYRSNDYKYKFLLKKKQYFDDLRKVLVRMSIHESIYGSSVDICKEWMNDIKSNVTSIRQNIAHNNNNKIYWRELKKDIEIMDLNFLEFHSTVINQLADAKIFPFSSELDFAKDYIKEYKNEKREGIDFIIKNLNEVKYAISNLSTPGHTHDEHLLQEETEKVHERLLMISFIAMAIPCGVAIMTPEISFIIKVLAATAIFSIPILYFIFRTIQKTFAFRRNTKNEINRKIKEGLNSISKSENNIDTLRKIEELPDDIKQGIIDLNQSGIDGQKKVVELLKKKL